MSPLCQAVCSLLPTILVEDMFFCLPHTRTHPRIVYIKSRLMEARLPAQHMIVFIIIRQYTSLSSYSAALVIYGYISDFVEYI